MRVLTLPAETDAPLVIRADAMLAGAVSPECFEMVAGRHAQISQPARAVDLGELAQGDTLNLWRQAVTAFTPPQLFGPSASKADNHEGSISRRDTLSIAGRGQKARTPR